MKLYQVVYDYIVGCNGSIECHLVIKANKVRPEIHSDQQRMSRVRQSSILHCTSVEDIQPLALSRIRELEDGRKEMNPNLHFNLRSTRHGRSEMLTVFYSTYKNYHLRTCKPYYL